MKRHFLQIIGLALVALAGVPEATLAADAKRQGEVARRGADVMPFSLEATTHIFDKTSEGGVQRVVAKNRSDFAQVRLVREHLHDIQRQFRKGDFSGPAHIHGADMPGLAELKAAKPGLITFSYADVEGGAQLTYRTRNDKLVAALHRWFDAQLSDHGAAAMQGGKHRHSEMHRR
ncbi:MAG: aspartate carbamoyltransferase [Variovorax sp.]